MLTHRLAPVDDPGLAVRGFYAIGRRLFGELVFVIGPALARVRTS